MSATSGIVPLTLPPIEPQRHGQTSKSTTWHGRDVSALETGLVEAERQIQLAFASLVQVEKDNQESPPLPTSREEQCIQNSRADKGTSVETKTIDKMHGVKQASESYTWNGRDVLAVEIASTEAERQIDQDLASLAQNRSLKNIPHDPQLLHKNSTNTLKAEEDDQKSPHLPISRKEQCVQNLKVDKWTQLETETLLQMYSNGKNPTLDKLCRALPGRSKCSIKRKRVRLGLVFNSGRWSEDETGKLKAMLAQEKKPSAKELSLALPGRSQDGIKLKKQRLDIVHGPKRWSKDETEKLKAMLAQEKKPSAKELSLALPGRTKESIRAKRIKLGL